MHGPLLEIELLAPFVSHRIPKPIRYRATATRRISTLRARAAKPTPPLRMSMQYRIG
jgi:hypothetical protein